MKHDPITSVKIDNMNSFLTQTQSKNKVKANLQMVFSNG